MTTEAEYIAADKALLNEEQLNVLFALTDRYRSFVEISKETGLSVGQVSAIME